MRLVSASTLRALLIVLLVSVCQAAPPTTGLIHHGLASDVTVTGRGISQVDDQSGSGNNATQATDGNRPYLSQDELGRPTIKFVAGSTTFLSLPGGTTALARSVSIFIIGRMGTSPNQSHVSLVSYAANTGMLRQVVSSSTQPLFYCANRASTTSLPRINPSLWGVISGAAASRVLTQDSTTLLAAVTNDTTPRTIEIGRNQAGASYGTFEAYEILIYNAALSDVDRAALVSHAVTTYGLPESYALNFLTEGDSQSDGSGLAVTDYSYPQQIYRASTSAWRQMCQAASGSTVASLTTRAGAIDGHLLAGARNVLLVLIGTNDATAADNSATIYSNLDTFVTARVSAGWEVWVGTVPSNSSLTGTLTAYNNKIKGTPLGGTGNGIIADAGASKVIDFASLSLTFQGDGTHPTEADCALMADMVAEQISPATPSGTGGPGALSGLSGLSGLGE